MPVLPPNDSPIVILYHAACTDGKAAELGACRLLRKAGYTNIHSYHIFPDKLKPETLAEIQSLNPGLVLLLDVCLPRPLLDTLNAWVIDHHEGNMQKHLSGYPRVVFDNHRSGAGLAWDTLAEWLGFEDPRPPIIHYVEDYDLWRFQHPNSREINTAIMLGNPATLKDDFLDQDPSALIEGGAAICYSNTQNIERAARQAIPLWINGLECVACNSSVLVNELAEHLRDLHQKVVCVWYALQDKTSLDLMVKVSLRSSADLPDTIPLAQVLGGNGHRNSSGAVLRLVEFLPLFNPPQVSLTETPGDSHPIV